jgi:hypothetical protein
LREEFRDVIEKLRRYCEDKGHPCNINADDPDAVARELTSGVIRR